MPGTTYNVTVSAVSSSVYSSPASRTVTTNVTSELKMTGEICSFLKLCFLMFIMCTVMSKRL